MRSGVGSGSGGAGMMPLRAASSSACLTRASSADPGDRLLRLYGTAVPCSTIE